MKIAVISDTHLKKDISKLEKFLHDRLNEVDLIIHAGDYTGENVVELLKGTGKFIGVYGNNDNDEIRKVLKEREIIEVEEFRIGIFHGHGEKGITSQRAYDCFKSDDIDIIIFGHSHQPSISTKQGTIMINPGSITSKRKEKMFSYIYIETRNNILEVNMRFAIEKLSI